MRKFTNPRGPLAFAWYSREEWLHLKEVAPDSSTLDATYDDWLANATRTAQGISDQGIQVVKVSIRIKNLLAWCTLHGREPDGEARARYAIELGRALPEPGPADT